LISRRRQQEDFQKGLETIVKGNAHAQTKAEWEEKATAACVNANIKLKTDALRAQYKERLALRQQRLCDLLSAEQAQYEQEIRDLEETPEQRKEKLAQKALALKKEREEQREKVVQEKLYQQWRAGEDELRAEDSRLFGLQMLQTRDDQCFDKLKAEAQEKIDEEVFEALTQENYKKMLDREMKEKETNAVRDAKTKKILTEQVALKAERVQKERDTAIAERKALAERFRVESEQEKLDRIREIEEARQKRATMDAFIRSQRGKREKEDAEERAEDKQWIASVLAREREVEKREQMEREKQQRENKEFRAALELEMQRKAHSDKELEEMQEAERLAQWRKREAVWEAEEDARFQLLQEVFADREAQLALKAKQREEIYEELARERDEIQREEERQAEIQQRKEEAEKFVRLRQQEELFRQMDFHQMQRQREQQILAIEKRKADLAEERLQKALEAERQKQKEVQNVILKNRAEREATRTAELSGVVNKANAASAGAGGAKLVAPWEKG